MVRVTTLMDNKFSEHKALVCKHGLSLFVETQNDSIIFDCGSGKDVIYNAKLLGIDISSANHLVCSHSHYDHVGGFMDVLAEGFHGKFYSGKGFFERKYAINEGKYTFLGAPFYESTLMKHNIPHLICDDVLEICSDCFLVTNFPRVYSFEEIPPRFVKDVNGRMQTDLFEDETSLVIKTEKGLIVIVGCSHPGILNMLCHIEKRFNESIYAVLGGTHLVEADEQRVNVTLDKLLEIGIQFIGLSHCSGDDVQEHMKEKGMQNCHMSVGSVVVF